MSDLLSESDARALIDEADRLLAPGCALAPVSLTHGTTLASRIACLPQRGSGALTGLVGRPTKVGDLLKPEEVWSRGARDHDQLGLPFEVLVFERQDGR